MASDAERKIAGTWYPPRSNQGSPGQLAYLNGELSVTSDADTALVSSAPFASADISDRIGTIPRKITFPDGTVFETADNAAVDQILSHQGLHIWSHVHKLEQFHPRLAGLVVAVVFLAFLIYRFTLPVLVEIAVIITPPVVPEMMSAGTMSTLDTTVMGPSALPEATKNEILKGFEKLVAASNHRDLRFTLNFRDGGAIGPNAFALPDGNVILTDQLVALAGGDTEMLLGVLAHELGHVEMKHSLRQMYQAAGAYGLVAMITGDLGSGLQDTLTGGVGFLALANSRSAESEADLRSVELMAKAGFDPTAIARFFKVIETRLGDTGKTSMLSTHPGTPDREKAILDYSKTLAGSQN